MDVLPAHLNRDSFRDSFKGLVALEIIIDLPIGFPINNIISQSTQTSLLSSNSILKGGKEGGDCSVKWHKDGKISIIELSM